MPAGSTEDGSAAPPVVWRRLSHPETSSIAEDPGGPSLPARRSFRISSQAITMLFTQDFPFARQGSLGAEALELAPPDIARRLLQPSFQRPASTSVSCRPRTPRGGDERDEPRRARPGRSISGWRTHHRLVVSPHPKRTPGTRCRLSTPPSDGSPTAQTRQAQAPRPTRFPRRKTAFDETRCLPPTTAPAITFVSYRVALGRALTPPRRRLLRFLATDLSVYRLFGATLTGR